MLMGALFSPGAYHPINQFTKSKFERYRAFPDAGFIEGQDYVCLTNLSSKRGSGGHNINVVENFKLLPGSDLKLFQAKALYKLASPSTPEPAREEALSLAESGERITHAKVQEIIAEHKAKANAAMEGFTTQVSGGFA